MSDPTVLFDAALRGAVIALALLLLSRFWPLRAERSAQRIGLALLLGLVVQTVSSTPALERGWPAVWQAPLVAVAVGNAVLFWLYARAHLSDGFVLRPWQAGLWLAAAALGALHCLFNGDATLNAWLNALLRATPIAFALAVGWELLRDWRGDLVEPRRRLRSLFLLLGIAYALLQSLGRLQGGGLLGPGAALLDQAAVLSLLAWLTQRAWTHGPDLGFATPPPAPAQSERPVEEAVEPALLAALQACMQGPQAAYRDENLSVASLAQRLRTPEYRLRRAILQGLGHRNFNAYVNGLRLAEVKTALSDPARRQLPILSLALDAGFGSIGPFNRAFKADTGLTPSEYRARQGSADS